MADTITSPEATISFPIIKTEKTADGDLIVYGKVTDGSVDSDEQIVDPTWSGEALKTWLSTGGNVRVQHNPHRDPAGVGLQVDVDRDGDGAHWLKALVVEPVAKRLVEKGALKAFSVGIMRPRLVSHAKALRGMIAGGDFGEVSLVDRPANKNCVFSIVKADKSGAPEWTGELNADEGFIDKAMKPSPADVAKAIAGRHSYETLPEVEKGELPEAQPVFADPVARRLNEALRQEALAEKRDFSAAQRRSAADSGAAMPDGSFPIKNRGDLSNAIHLAGHAKDPGAARAHIKRRASALGASDMIPDSWKGTMDEVDEVAEVEKADGMKCKTCSGSGKMRGGSVKCPDCKGSGMMASAKADGEGTDDDAAEKAVKKPMPPKAADEDDSDDGAGNDGGGDDSDDGRDSNVDPAIKKSRQKTNPAAPDPNLARPKHPGKDGPNAKIPGNSVTDHSMNDDNATGSGGPAGDYTGNKMEKVMSCSACGSDVAKSAAFCSGCGAAFKAKKMKGKKAGKLSGSDPAAGVKAKPGTKRVPPGPELHRDDQLGPMGWSGSGGKDGSAVMSGSGTQSVGGSGGTSMKAEEPSYSIARAHDAFCPAWGMEVVYEEYPSLKSIASAVSSEELREAAVKSIGGGDYFYGEQLLAMAREADVIAETDASVLDDVRASMNKGFQSLYPTAKPTPGSVSPGMFKRPYISAGHAPLSAQPAGGSAPAKMPPPPPSAGNFTRGPLDGGHQSPSPGNKSDGMRMAPSGETFSRRVMPKYDATQAIQSLHDRITGMYPRLCPMEATEHGIPSPVAKGEDSEAAVTKVAKKMKKTVQVLPAAVPDGFDISEITKAFQTELDKAVGTLPSRDELAEVLAGYKEKSEEQERRIASLQDLIDKMGSQPDPGQAPVRGININGPASGGSMQPVERRSLVDEAIERQRAEKLQFLKSLSSSGDPVMREMAEAQINKMLKA